MRPEIADSQRPNAARARNPRILQRGLAVLLVLLLGGCGSTGPAPVYDASAPPPDGYYRIRSGDTLYGIARRHRVGYQKLAQWNDMGPPYRLYAGSLLRVRPPERRSGAASRGPRTVDATKPSRPQADPIVKTSTEKPTRPTVGSATAGRDLKWQWPIKGRVVQGFRAGDRTRKGIRIAGRPGQKVLAAEAGTVVYSGSGLKGYGDLIIVKHNNSYLSAYGFNRRLLVSEGARVSRGQGLAEVGQASNGEYRLHFEIRRSGTAVDPLRYLP